MDGRVKNTNSEANSVPKHTILRTRRYFWYLSSKKPKKNDPTSPLVMKVAPITLQSEV